MRPVVLCIVGIAGLVTLYFFYSAKEFNDEGVTLTTVDSSSEDWGDYAVRAISNKNIKTIEGFVDVSGVQIFRREVVDTSRAPYGNHSISTWNEIYFRNLD